MKWLTYTGKPVIRLDSKFQTVKEKQSLTIPFTLFDLELLRKDFAHLLENDSKELTLFETEGDHIDGHCAFAFTHIRNYTQ